jgi:hypothetical protein
MVQLEGSAGKNGEVLELSYHPVAGPSGGVAIRMPAGAAQQLRRDARILYDEFDLNEEHAFFTHSLLLTDGREIEVRFHSLTVRRIGHVFTPTELTEREVKWPLAESLT